MKPTNAGLATGTAAASIAYHATAFVGDVAAVGAGALVTVTTIAAGAGTEFLLGTGPALAVGIAGHGAAGAVTTGVKTGGHVAALATSAVVGVTTLLVVDGVQIAGEAIYRHVSDYFRPLPPRRLLRLPAPSTPTSIPDDLIIVTTPDECFVTPPPSPPVDNL